MKDWPDCSRGRRWSAAASLLCAFVSAGIGACEQAAAAPVDASDLARCAALSAAQKRLACYDELAGRVAAPRPAANSDTTATASIPNGGADAAADSSKFGLTPAQLHQTRALGPAAITATVTAIAPYPSAPGRVSIQLDNGQSWLLSDDDAGVSSGDSVTIRRASLGSFLLITAGNRSYRVQRTK